MQSDRTIARLTERLLERRNEAGHWEGHLSSSALSTATATVALTLHDRNHRLIKPGIEWLIAHQNDDGGWGDTVVSLSNLSTTLLSWAAVGTVYDRPGAHRAPLQKTEDWLRRELGDLKPENLREAILRRYGKDRTFSVPILTVLALTGKLASWRQVPQLPFELAALPHTWFQWVRLPVVSYALPALVAIGQVRHHGAPTRNPLSRAIRSALRTRTLGIARNMQPESGGYLEATPLTAFVSMSLIHSGAAQHPIVINGIRFLEKSVRGDGSWPIDTNLATWVTTLSVHALAPDALAPGERQRILQWLLAQQVRVEHPFTRAQPGGWAWTDLSGGVPDADDTSGALVALKNLDGVGHADAAIHGVQWLLDIQNSDGGIPTFCRGWGTLPFDRSAPDLTAHALEAWSCWHDSLPPRLQQRVKAAADRAVTYLARQQRADSGWLPLWFGNQHTSDETNPTYGTARVISGLRSALAFRSPLAKSAQQRGIAWLLKSQNSDGGWGGVPGVPSSIEETGLALAALSESSVPDEALRRGADWLIRTTDEGRHTPASPIGLYFARLWYYEELYPIIFALRGLRRALHL